MLLIINGNETSVTSLLLVLLYILYCEINQRMYYFRGFSYIASFSTEKVLFTSRIQPKRFSFFVQKIFMRCLSFNSPNRSSSNRAGKWANGEGYQITFQLPWQNYWILIGWELGVQLFYCNCTPVQEWAWGINSKHSKSQLNKSVNV